MRPDLGSGAKSRDHARIVWSEAETGDLCHSPVELRSGQYWGLILFARHWGGYLKLECSMADSETICSSVIEETIYPWNLDVLRVKDWDDWNVWKCSEAAGVEECCDPTNPIGRLFILYSVVTINIRYLKDNAKVIRYIDVYLHVVQVVHLLRCLLVQVTIPL